MFNAYPLIFSARMEMFADKMVQGGLLSLVSTFISLWNLFSTVYYLERLNQKKLTVILQLPVVTIVLRSDLHQYHMRSYRHLLMEITWLVQFIIYHLFLKGFVEFRLPWK